MTQRYIGRWMISRSIFDRAASTAIDCHGEATLQPDAGRLRYDERVWFRLGGKLLQATRAYHFATHAQTIGATFADGTPFFELTLDAAGSGTAGHRCGSDLYTLTLNLRDDDCWSTRWDVSGTKDQRLVTDYTRVPPSPIAELA